MPLSRRCNKRFARPFLKALPVAPCEGTKLESGQMLRGRDALKPPTPPPRAVRVSMAEPSRSDQSRAWNSREYNSKQTESEPKGASWLKARGRDDDRRRPDIGGRTYGTVPSTYTRQERIRPGYGHVPSQDSADAVWGSATSQLRNDGVEGSMVSLPLDRWQVFCIPLSGC